MPRVPLILHTFLIFTHIKYDFIWQRFKEAN